MSFDLMVFDPGAVAWDREGFLAWYESQFNGTEEGHIYDDPSMCTPALKAWFLEMIGRFPALNGPYASDHTSGPEIDGDSKIADYSFAPTSIYVEFRWSEAGRAYEAMFDAGKKHKVGFLDVSANNGQVWVPDPNGDYVCLHGD